MKRLNFISVFVFVLFCGHVFSEPVGLTTGTGYDSLALEVRGDCITYESIDPVFNTNGQKVIMTLELIEDRKMLQESLGVSANAAFNASGVSVDGSVEFARGISMNNYSLYLLVRVSVKNQEHRLVNAKIKEDEYKLLGENAEAFRVRCGDSFVNGYISGGTYYAMLVFETSNRTEHESLKTKLQGASKLIGASFDVSSIKELQDVINSSRVSLKTDIRGGYGVKIPLSQTDVLNFAINFPTLVAEPPVGTTSKASIIHSYGFAKYSTLKTPALASPVDVLIKHEIIASLLKYKNENDSLIADIDYIISNPSQFSNIDYKLLNDLKIKAERNINKIYESWRECYRDPSLCKVPTLDFLGSNQLPERKHCKSPEYITKMDPKCGDIYKKGTGPVCGVKKYNVSSGPVCGPATFKSKKDPKCGPETFKKKKNKKCPKKYIVKTAVGIIFPVTSHACIKADGIDSKGCYVYTECRIKENGVEEWKKCTDPSFGVETYKTCEHNSFGPSTFNECRDISFGVESWKTCSRKEFGFLRCND